MFTNRKYFYFVFIVAWTSAGAHVDRTLDAGAFDSRSREHYVDPHSFFYDKHHQAEVEKNVPSVRERSSNRNCNQVFNDCLSGNVKDIPDDLFSRRLINRLLSIVNFEEDDELLVGNIVIELTHSELTRLKNFGTGKITAREVDALVIDVFRAPKTTIFFDIYSIFHHATSKTYGFLWPHKEIVILFITVVQLTWLLVRTRWTFLKTFLVFLLVAFVASFVITYFQLLKEAEIKLTAKQFRFEKIPAHCQPDRMSWIDKILSFFSSQSSCIEYYEAIMEDHRFHVTPVQVLSRVIGTFVLEPAGMIGRAFGDFVHHSTHHMSAPVQWILQPILLVAIIAALILGIAFVFSGFLRSMILGPFSILWSLGGDNSRQNTANIRSKETREPIEVILNLKLSTDNSSQMFIRSSDNEPKVLSIKNEEGKNGQLASSQKFRTSGGGDADNVAHNDKSFDDSSLIDGNSNDKVESIQESASVSGEGDCKLRRRGKKSHYLLKTDSDDN